jgi:hypothetical protein
MHTQTTIDLLPNKTYHFTHMMLKMRLAQIDQVSIKQDKTYSVSHLVIFSLDHVKNLNITYNVTCTKLQTTNMLELLFLSCKANNPSFHNAV